MGSLIETEARKIHETKGGCPVCAKYTTYRPLWEYLQEHSIQRHLYFAKAQLLENLLRLALPIVMNAHDLPPGMLTGPIFGAGCALLDEIDAAKKAENDK